MSKLESLTMDEDSDRLEGEMTHLANWIEIPTLNLERAKRFYGSILGAELADMKIADTEYAIFGVKDTYNCGALVRGDSYWPSQDGVVVYLDGGNDLSKVLDRVKKAGGMILVEKTFLSPEAGYMGIFIDSEGNRIGLQSMT